MPKGKGEGEAHATCEPRRTEDWLIDEAETRRQGGEVVSRPGNGADRLGGELGGGGARSRWRRKNGEKRGARSAVALLAGRWHGRRGKRGSRVRRRMEGKMGERGWG
jgi:hypothetical protein